MDNKYWLSNKTENQSEEPDNFLMGQLLSPKQSKRQNTADHIAVSFWRQEEIGSLEEVSPVVEEALPHRAQYTERVLRGLVSSNIELEELTPSEPALDLDAFTSILAVSAKQKFVNHTFLNHVLDQAEPQAIVEEYYDENEEETWSPNTVRAA